MRWHMAERTRYCEKATARAIGIPVFWSTSTNKARAATAGLETSMVIEAR
jgi:hypothetical protein